MKILWFTHSLCGATEKLRPDIKIGGWVESLERQIKLNKDVELSVGFYYNGKLSPFEYNSVNYYPINIGQNKTKLHKFRNRINLFRASYDSYLTSKLVEVIKDVKPDIIHIHGSEGNFGMVQWYTQKPIVISIQGLLNPYCEKYFSGIPRCIALKNESYASKLLLNSVNNQFFLFSKWAAREAMILNDAKYIIGRTNWDRRVTRILAPKSEYFVGNEVLRPSFYNNTWEKTSFNKRITIVTIMSDGIYKGLESVLKTASILTDYCFDFEWLILGQSSSGNYPQMVKHWLKKGYKENNIVLSGRKNEYEIVDILCMADIYCQVSHIENSPNSVCEAMLLGLPIVATFAGGTDSLLENNKEGLLVQDGDPFSLAGAILELANDFPKSKHYGNSARQIALVRHNPQRVANEVLDIYREICSSKTES